MALPSLAARIEAAKIAYDQLMRGAQAVRVVDQNGETVEYARSNAARLLGYIEDLEAQQAGSTRTRGPMKVFFK